MQILLPPATVGRREFRTNKTRHIPLTGRSYDKHLKKGCKAREMTFSTVIIALLLHVHTYGVTITNKQTRSTCISLVQIEDVPHAAEGEQWLHQIARYLLDVIRRIPTAGITIQERPLLYFNICQTAKERKNLVDKS
jgi:hypothetical protein